MKSWTSPSKFSWPSVPAAHKASQETFIGCAELSLRGTLLRLVLRQTLSRVPTVMAGTSAPVDDVE